MIDCLYIVLPITVQSHLVTTRCVVLTVTVIVLSPDISHSIFLSITRIRLYMYYSNVLRYRPIDSELVIGNYATYMFTVHLS